MLALGERYEGLPGDSHLRLSRYHLGFRSHWTTQHTCNIKRWVGRLRRQLGSLKRNSCQLCEMKPKTQSPRAAPKHRQTSEMFHYFIIVNGSWPGDYPSSFHTSWNRPTAISFNTRWLMLKQASKLFNSWACFSNVWLKVWLYLLERDSIFCNNS